MRERECYVEVGRRIREARKRAGMTQQDLGDEVNLSRTSITNIESGNQPVTIWLLHLVSSAVDCALIDLLPTLQEPGQPTFPTDVPPKTAAVLHRLAAGSR